jgi:hypothetical protein
MKSRGIRAIEIGEATEGSNVSELLDRFVNETSKACKHAAGSESQLMVTLRCGTMAE